MRCILLLFTTLLMPTKELEIYEELQLDLERNSPVYISQLNVGDSLHFTFTYTQVEAENRAKIHILDEKKENKVFVFQLRFNMNNDTYLYKETNYTDYTVTNTVKNQEWGHGGNRNLLPESVKSRGNSESELIIHLTRTNYSVSINGEVQENLMQNNREGLEFHKGAYLAVYNGESVKFLSKAVRAYYMHDIILSGI
ncbi:hypothetical protein ACHWQZ_G000691 [Mnemiopsis leidyi]